MRNQILDELKRRYGTFQPSVVFDVGANIGQSVKEFRQIYPSAIIHAFEPVPASFEALKQAAKSDHLTTCWQIALGPKEGVLHMLNRGTSTGNRIVESKQPSDSIEVEVLTGDAFCRREGISQIDFLKVDAEGFDLSVLVGFSDMLRRGAVDMVQAEVGLSPENQRHVPLERMSAFMFAQGYKLFRIVGIHNQKRLKPPIRAGAHYGDAVYIRPAA